MKITPAQTRKIRELAELSTTLWRLQRGLANERNEKMQQLLDTQRELTRAQQLRDRVPGGPPRSKTEDADTHEVISQLKDAIAALDEQIAGISGHCGAAAKLVERLLEASGQQHIDFPGAGQIYPAGMGRTA